MTARHTQLRLLAPGTQAAYGFPEQVNPFEVELVGRIGPWDAILSFPLTSFLGSSVWGLLGRFRRAVGVERLQLKWLVACGGLVAPALVIVARFAPAAVVVGLVVGAASLILRVYAGGVLLLRAELDLDGLVSDLLGAVRDTLHPASVTVWLQPEGWP